MNNREIEQLIKKSIYSMEISDELRKNIIDEKIKQLTKEIHQNLRNTKLCILVFEIKH